MTPDGETSPLRIAGSAPAASAAALAAMATAFAAAVALRAAGGTYVELFRDPAAQFGIPIHAGLFSTLGALCLVVAASAALLGGIAARDRILLAAAALSTVLALDDLFLFHEALGPEDLGIPETATLAVYAVAISALTFFHVRGDGLAGRGGLFVALALLGASAATDLVTEYSYRSVLVEDICKFGGYAAWATYWFTTALSRVQARALPGGIE